MRYMLKIAIIAAVFVAGLASPVIAQFGPRPVLEDAIVSETSDGPAIQVSTNELRALIASGSAVLLDARPPEEFGMSHIPGALNVAPKPGVPISVYVSDVEEVKRLVPDFTQLVVLYCNGPFCGKSKRLGAELAAAGFLNIKRYQLGMPGWRTAGGVAVIELEQLYQVKALDHTAWFVDAGMARPRPGRTVRILVNEVVAAKDDGRLPMHDHNTRLIVLGANAEQARAVAQAIAANAFHNVAYYNGSADTLSKFAEPQP